MSSELKDYLVSSCDSCGRAIWNYNKYYTVRIGHTVMDLCENCVTEWEAKDTEPKDWKETE